MSTQPARSANGGRAAGRLPLGVGANGRPDWPKSAVRVAFGIIWAIDASLKWLPGFRSNYADTISSAANGQPGWLHPWFNFWINIQHPRIEYFAYLVASIETLIALALILGFARKVTYISGAVLSLLIWATAEGFGGPYASGASDVGTAIIYAVVFFSLLAISAQEGTSRYSLDAVLERRVSWWHWVAEVGGHHKPAPAAIPEKPKTIDQPSRSPDQGQRGERQVV